MTETAPARRSRWFVAGVLFLVLWVVALIVGVVAVFAGVGGGGTTVTRWAEVVERDGSGDKIALIQLEGEIVGGSGSDGGAFSAATLGARDYVSQIRQASEDASVRGVIVLLNTPGGAVVASDEIYKAVEDLDSRKPVYAVMADVAASGGYYVAAGARRIFANPATITGSIGVIATFPNLEGTADKLGIRMRIFKSGDLKDLGSPFRGFTAEERTVIQDLIGEAYDQFVGVVATGRSITEQRVRSIADGRIYSGTQAKNLGLVDTLGGLDDAFEAIKAEVAPDASLVRYARFGGFASALFGFSRLDERISAAVTDAAREVTGVPEPGLSYLWLP